LEFGANVSSRWWPWRWHLMDFASLNWERSQEIKYPDLSTLAPCRSVVSQSAKARGRWRPPLIDDLSSDKVKHLLSAINDQYSCNKEWVFKFQ
jgi:hypothetical protein